MAAQMGTDYADKGCGTAIASEKPQAQHADLCATPGTQKADDTPCTEDSWYRGKVLMARVLQSAKYDVCATLNQPLLVGRIGHLPPSII